MKKKKAASPLPAEKTSAPKRWVREFSAGGVVRRGNDLLLVKVENLEGRVVWTFPKGHLEKGETSEQAAVREVEEETGWRCAVTKPFGSVRYFFYRNKQPVNKVVRWFLMEPLVKTGKPDPEEILDCRWTPAPAAAELLVYKSDREVLGRLKR
jgi:8-oxo-dGTP pyrophosphatase MutT (NUDIX family)